MPVRPGAELLIVILRDSARYVDGHDLPTRLVHAASPGSCLAECAPVGGGNSPAYALPLLAGELLEITVSGLDASHAGVPAEQAAVATTVRRALATQGWPEAVMFMYVTTLEAAIELRPALLSTSKAWELDRVSSSWRIAGASPGGIQSQNWPAHESVSFRVLSSRAAAEAHDVRELEAKLRSELLNASAAEGAAARARLLYRLGRAQELLGMSKATSETLDTLIELRGNGALDEHVHHAYVVSGSTLAARGRLEQGILRFLAAYELLPERGVEPLVEAAKACRQSGKTPNLARLFAFAAVAENLAMHEDGRPVPNGAYAAAYDHLADVEALVAVRDVGQAALSALRSSLAAAARLLRNDAAPRFLWRVWKYNAVTVLEKLKLRDDVIAVQAQVDDVVEALVSAAPNCEIEEVILGAAERQRGCPAFAGMLSQRLLIVEWSSGSVAAARLAISLGCDSYLRVKVPARMMHAELRAEPATGESGRQARTTFAHLCAVAHVASAMPNETLQVLIMQDNVTPLAPADLFAVVERTAVALRDSHNDARGARLTLLGGDTLENSMHAYALSLDGAQLIARSLSYVSKETGVLLQSRFHALIQPLILAHRLLIDAAIRAPFPVAMEHRNQLYENQGAAFAADLIASAQLVLTCISFDGHASHRRDLLADVRERYWLIPWLLRNATGLQVRLVGEDESSNAHAILLLYESHNQTEALARAGELCRAVPLVIALESGQSGSIDVCSRPASEEQARVATTSLPSIPRWLQAALVQRSPESWLDGIDFYPGLLHTQHHVAWLRKPTLAAQLWYDNEDAHRVRNLLSLAGVATQQIVVAAAEREHMRTASTPLQEQLHAVRVVVTLTSIPPRIHFLPRVVASLLNQTRAPDVIYIILPLVWARGDASEWMPGVDRMARHIENLDPRIVVQRPLIDLGPVMKLLPTLESENSRVDSASGVPTRTLLLYLDDDWMFPPGFVHAFVAASARKPGKLIFRSCGDALYDDARRDAHTQWLGCSLPEAFGGVLLPLQALHAADLTGGVAVKTIYDIVSRVVAHPACLRGDDFVLGELYVRLSIQSERLPSDLETTMGGTQLRLMDTAYALNGGNDDIVPSRYAACAQHLTATLDALLPMMPLKPALPPRLLPNLHTSAMLFGEYRYAVVENVEQAVQALSVGAVPLMVHCPKRRVDRELYTRVLSVSRMVCIGRSGTYLLDRFLHNASVQQAVFAQPAVTPGALKLIQSSLADVASLLHALFWANRTSVDSGTVAGADASTAPPTDKAVVESATDVVDTACKSALAFVAAAFGSLDPGLLACVFCLYLRPGYETQVRFGEAERFTTVRPEATYIRALQSFASDVSLSPGFRFTGPTLAVAADDATLPTEVETAMGSSGIPFLAHAWRGSCDNITWKEHNGVVFVPDPVFVLERGYKALIARMDATAPPWKTRERELFWRGGTTGRPLIASEQEYVDSPLNRCMALPRLRFAAFAANLTWTDIKISHWVQACDFMASSADPSPVLTALHGAYVPEGMWSRYRAILDIDGNSNAWGLYWRLASGSVVFRVDSYCNHYTAGLRPWVHFVPLPNDAFVNHSSLASITALAADEDWDSRLQQIAAQARQRVLSRGYDWAIASAASQLNSFSQRLERASA